jgi:hypothetical protein
LIGEGDAKIEKGEGIDKEKVDMNSNGKGYSEY